MPSCPSHRWCQLVGSASTLWHLPLGTMDPTTTHRCPDHDAFQEIPTQAGRERPGRACGVDLTNVTVIDQSWERVFLAIMRERTQASLAELKPDAVLADPSWATMARVWVPGGSFVPMAHLRRGLEREEIQSTMSCRHSVIPGPHPSVSAAPCRPPLIDVTP